MTPIDFSRFSTRTRNCLRAEGLEYVEQIADMSDTELLSIPNLGKWCWSEIRRAIPEETYDLSISRPLSVEQLSDMYHKAKGFVRAGKIYPTQLVPITTLRKWAKRQGASFYVCPSNGTIHQIIKTSPMPDEHFMRWVKSDLAEAKRQGWKLTK